MVNYYKDVLGIQYLPLQDFFVEVSEESYADLNIQSGDWLWIANQDIQSFPVFQNMMEALHKNLESQDRFVSHFVGELSLEEVLEFVKEFELPIKIVLFDHSQGLALKQVIKDNVRVVILPNPLEIEYSNQIKREVWTSLIN